MAKTRTYTGLFNNVVYHVISWCYSRTSLIVNWEVFFFFFVNIMDNTSTY